MGGRRVSQGVRANVPWRLSPPRPLRRKQSRRTGGTHGVDFLDVRVVDVGDEELPRERADEAEGRSRPEHAEALCGGGREESGSVSARRRNDAFRGALNAARSGGGLLTRAVELHGRLPTVAAHFLNSVSVRVREQHYTP